MQLYELDFDKNTEQNIKINNRTRKRGEIAVICNAIDRAEIPLASNKEQTSYLTHSKHAGIKHAAISSRL